MRHLNHISRLHLLPSPARSLLVWQAQLEVLNALLDALERVLGLIKGESGE